MGVFNWYPLGMVQPLEGGIGGEGGLTNQSPTYPTSKPTRLKKKNSALDLALRQEGVDVLQQWDNVPVFLVHRWQGHRKPGRDKQGPL